MKKKRRIFSPWLFLICVCFLFSLALSRMEDQRHRQGKQQLEQALRTTAAACYACEGFYPPSVSYMQEHYGLRYDSGEYVVRYELFASNLMPDITVLDK